MTIRHFRLDLLIYARIYVTLSHYRSNVFYHFHFASIYILQCGDELLSMLDDNEYIFYSINTPLTTNGRKLITDTKIEV